MTSAVDAYYALVTQHRLRDSWNWLSPAYQQRLGWDYYGRFWAGVSQVQLLSVRPEAGAVALQLRYVETNGTVSTERANVTFVVDPSSHRILINSYRVTG